LGSAEQVLARQHFALENAVYDLRPPRRRGLDNPRGHASSIFFERAFPFHFELFRM